MSEIKPDIPKIPKSKIFVSEPIPIRTKDVNRITKADLEFEEIDHTGQSFEGCIFLNNPVQTMKHSEMRKTVMQDHFLFLHMEESVMVGQDIASQYLAQTYMISEQVIH